VSWVCSNWKKRHVLSEVADCIAFSKLHPFRMTRCGGGGNNLGLLLLLSCICLTRGKRLVLTGVADCIEYIKMHPCRMSRCSEAL
jgi:hypothetical protein